MASPKIDVKVEGLDALKSKFRPALVKDALKDALDEIGKAGAEAAQQGAPTRTGKLRGSTSHKVRGTSHAMVEVKAQNQRGYPYPRALEYGAKYGHKGWLKRAVDRVARRFDAILSDMGRKIEDKVNG